MVNVSIPQLTVEQARFIKTEASRRGDLGALNCRIASALLGGYSPAYEANLMTMWAVLNEGGA